MALWESTVVYLISTIRTVLILPHQQAGFVHPH